MDDLQWKTLLKWMIWWENPPFSETPILMSVVVVVVFFCFATYGGFSLSTPKKPSGFGIPIFRTPENDCSDPNEQ